MRPPRSQRRNGGTNPRHGAGIFSGIGPDGCRTRATQLPKAIKMRCIFTTVNGQLYRPNGVCMRARSTKWKKSEIRKIPSEPLMNAASGKKPLARRQSNCVRKGRSESQQFARLQRLHLVEHFVHLVTRLDEGRILPGLGQIVIESIAMRTAQMVHQREEGGDHARVEMRA